MPRGDGTGPVGMGPLTGRSAGFCARLQNSGSFRLWPRVGPWSGPDSDGCFGLRACCPDVADTLLTDGQNRRGRSKGTCSAEKRKTENYARGDGTGPMEMGRMTGKNAGYCRALRLGAVTNPVGYGKPGCGFGRGRGFRRMFNATGLRGWARYGYPAYAGADEEAPDEREFLSNRAEFLEKQLQQ